MNYAGFTRPVWTWLRAATTRLPNFLGTARRRAPAGRRTRCSPPCAPAGAVSWRSYDPLLAAARLARHGPHPHRRRRPGAAEVAAGLLLTMPGTPMVFAGDEIGLTGTNGEDARTPMPWHRPDELGPARRCARVPGAARAAPRRAGAAPRRAALGARGRRRAASSCARAVEERLLVLAARARAPAGAAAASGLGVATARRRERVRRRAGAAPRTRTASCTLPGDGPAFQVWQLALKPAIGRSPRMAEVVLDKVNKQYENGFHAVKDLDLDVEDGEFLVLVGPSGCGKTTALRMIAGLEEITAGDAATSASGASTTSRPKTATSPWCSRATRSTRTCRCDDNIALRPAKRRKRPKAEIDRRVEEAAEHARAGEPAAAQARSSCRAASGNASRWAAPSCASRRCS